MPQNNGTGQNGGAGNGAGNGTEVVGSGAQVTEKLVGPENFASWKFAMMHSLKWDGLWNSVLDTETNPVKKERALSKICLSVNSSCYIHLRDAKTAKEAWDNLQGAYADKGIIRRCALKRKLIRTRFEDFESMREYLEAITAVCQELEDIDCKIEDAEKAELMINNLPDRFEPIIYGIWGTCNGQLTSKLVMDQLLPMDQRATPGDEDKAFAAKSQGFVPTCHHCNEVGHIKPRCPKLPKKPKKKKPKFEKGKSCAKDSEVVALTTALGASNFCKSDWIVDSGCSNHMCNDRDKLQNAVTISGKEICVANSDKLMCGEKGDVI